MGDSYDDYEAEQAMYEASLDNYLEDPTWKMRDGTIILMRNMTTSHIQACIALVERRLALNPNVPAKRARICLSCLKDELDSRKGNPHAP